MRRHLLLPLLLAALTVLAAAWPVASDPSGTILCAAAHPDCLGNHWLLEWVATQLRTGGSLLHNDRTYWPVGDAPWLAGNGGEGFLYAPLSWSLGWPLGANVYLLGVLVGNGLATWALARVTGASRAAALSSVTAGASLAYAMHELGAGRFTQADVAWLAGFLAAWVALLRAPSVGRALLAGGLYAVASALYWYHGVFAALAGGTLLLARVLASPAEARALTRPLGVFVAVVAVLLAAPLGVFLHGWASIPGASEVTSFPHPEAIADSAWPQVPFLVRGGRHAGQALALTTCVLALLGAFRGLRHHTNNERDTATAPRWLVAGMVAVAGLFVLLTAGNMLPNGPFSLVYGLAAPLRRFWWPSRHAVVTSIMLVTLGSLGVDVLLGWARRRVEARHGEVTGKRAVLTLAIALAVAVPLQLEAQGAAWHPHFSRVSWPEPFHASLRDLPGDVVVEPPLAPEVASSQAPLMLQRLHGKALLTGPSPWVARVRPAGWDAFVAKNTLLAGVQAMERGELVDGVLWFRGEDLRALLDRGVRIWVIDAQHFPRELAPLLTAYDVVLTQLFGAPVRRSDTARAFDAAGWDGVTTEVRFPRWTWPKGMRPAAQGLPLQGTSRPTTFLPGEVRAPPVKSSPTRP